MGERVLAAVVEGAQEKPVVAEVQLPDLGHDEVLVRVAATGICHTDLAWAAGELDFDFPVVLGHETSGIVEAVGPHVERVAPGDKVVISLAHHCGHCPYCESGRPMLCSDRTKGWDRRLRREGRPVLQGLGIGGFAEATVVRERSVVRVPEAVPLRTAAVVGCAVATGIGSVTNIAEVTAGATVAVIGCGGVGSAAVMGAGLVAAGRIVAVDPAPARRRLARRLGATDDAEDGEDLLGLEPAGFDYVFEAAGRVEAMEAAVRATKPGGTVTLIGAPAPDATLPLPALDFVVSQRRLLGCITGNLRPNIDFPRYFRLYERGLLDLDALISGSIPLRRIAEGFEHPQGDREGIRTLVEMDAALGSGG